VADLYFEDLAVGRRFDTAGLTLSEAEIVDFARRFDAQPFHVDAEAARRSPYGSLFLQTGAMAAGSLGSPGFDEVRWLQPVRPGDTLRVEVEVTAARPSSSKPDRGIVTLAYRTLNQRDEVVCAMIGRQLMRRRPS
jgi:acyl dehydratase